MRKFIVFFVTTIFLISCAGPIITVESTATFVPLTSTTFPTLTAIPAIPPITTTEKTPTVYESSLGQEYLSTHSVTGSPELLGIKMNVSFGFDKSLEDKLKTITLKEGWTNDNSDAGLSAADSLNKIVLEEFVRLYNIHGGPDGSGIKNKVTLEQYASLLQIAQSTGQQADWEKVKFWIFVNDRTTPYKMEKVTIYPMRLDSEVVAEQNNGRAVNKFIVAFVNGKKMKDGEFEIAYADVGSGGAADLYPDGTLILSVSPAISSWDSVNKDEYKAVETLVSVFGLLERRGFLSSISEIMMEHIANNVSSRKEMCSAAFDFSP